MGHERSGEPNLHVRTRGGLRFVGVALLVLGVVACVHRWAPPEPERYHRTEPLEGAGSEIGAAKCFACHDSFDEHHVASRGHEDCEACHGPGQLHDYTAKATDIAYPSNEACAKCHEVGSRTLMGWSTSEHARSGVLCSDCHDTHDLEVLHVRGSSAVEGAMLRDASGVTRMCSSCHPEIAAKFDLPSHHPMSEGMLSCTDCHSPHENRAESLGATTQVCGECHQEVMGPWIWEHAPVVEDCGQCHTPHGSSADFLLEMNQPAVCIACHTLPLGGAVHQPWSLTSRCTDCHNAIHGSYSDSKLRR